MPFTFFHWFLSLLLQTCFMLLDPVALFVGSVIIDIEGIASIFLFRELNLPLHGPFHSFLGALVSGFFVGLCSWLFFRSVLPFIIEISRIEVSFSLPTFSLKLSLISSYIGTFSHILLDAPLYNDMNPWYPITSIENPFLNIVDGSFIYLFCVICFFLGLSLLFIRYGLKLSKET